MLRGFILLVLVGGLVLLASPFVISSLYVDQRGITITGRVYFKREVVTIHNSGWNRYAQATIEYAAPDQSGVSFFDARLDPEHYDALHKGQAVSLHYLRRRDIPTVPLSHVLSEMHALPTVRLAGQKAFSDLRRSFTRNVIILCGVIAGVVILLFLWRATRLPGFWWAVGLCVLVAIAALLIQDFPTPTPRPAIHVLKASARVSSVGRIYRLFEGSHDQGVIADQPIEVVGIEFVPAGRTEPVVAVDLIDKASVPGLKENSIVPIEYEGESPRTAYIQTATRTFVSRNLSGIAVQTVLSVLVLAAFLLGALFIGRAWKRLLQRRA
jgi:hypothetical protein